MYADGLPPSDHAAARRQHDSHSDDLFRRRRARFDAYFEENTVGALRWPDYGERVTCPCCGYPTLFARRRHQICVICHWEDDGQDDRDADVVRGGPNGEYSLAEARRHYQQYGLMYDPARTIQAFANVREAVSVVKREVIRAFDAVLAADEDQWAELLERADAIRRRLREVMLAGD